MRRPIPNTVLGLVLFLGTGCAAPIDKDLLLIGHGGMGPDGPYPMNSRAALLGGLAAGNAGIEMDVQLSADGVLVIHHDQYLRAGGTDPELINSRTVAQLADRNSPGNDVLALEPFLAEAQKQYPEAEFTLDIKLFAAGDWSAYLDVFSDRLSELSRASWLKKPLIIECRTEEFLELLGRKESKADLYYYTDQPLEGIATASRLGCTGITIQYDRIDTEEVEQAHGAGLEVTVFGVGNWWAERRARGLRPDRIQLDL